MRETEGDKQGLPLVTPFAPAGQRQYQSLARSGSNSFVRSR